jgi:quercetin dioxygenase-like cupin family protein
VVILPGRIVVQDADGASVHEVPRPSAYPDLPGVRKAVLHELDRPGLRFNVVEFDAGSTVPPHPSPTVNCWFVLHGEIASTVSGREPLMLRAGDCCLQVDVEHGWAVGPDGPAALLAVVVDLATPKGRP